MQAKILSVAMIAALAGLLSACSKPAPAEDPIRSVKVITVGLGSPSSEMEFSGEVKARVESRLGFRVGGKITRRAAEVGQHVKAGEVLAQLDSQDYQLSVDAARAQVAAATTNRDLAAANFKRFKELRDQNFISPAELERHEASLKSAQSQWDQAQAQLAGQGNQARYTTLVADVSGVVTATDAEAGQVIAAGTPVVRIAKDGPRDVVFAVPEDKVQALRVGSAATVVAWASSAPMKAQIREVAASADPVTRTFAVKAGLDSKDALPLGTTVTLKAAALSHAAQPVFKLPTSALVKEGQNTAVWVLQTGNMTVQLTPIEIATADGNDVVVKSGLQAGMQVVTAGVHVLSPGQKVTLYQAPAAAQAVSASAVKN